MNCPIAALRIGSSLSVASRLKSSIRGFIVTAACVVRANLRSVQKRRSALKILWNCPERTFIRESKRARPERAAHCLTFAGAPLNSEIALGTNRVRPGHFLLPFWLVGRFVLQRLDLQREKGRGRRRGRGNKLARPRRRAETEGGSFGPWSSRLAPLALRKRARWN